LSRMSLLRVGGPINEFANLHSNDEVIVFHARS
jgi:hypothetical protein